ncbi:MAG: GAF domain-containing protein [Deltaproteobacteria bacterium]|nr:GAF domain-containing protein [Deltaproteobacteria bacterium]
MTFTLRVEMMVAVVQELSLARTLEGVMRVVRREARALTGADGATFVLRDGDRCHYADEDAIAPLWKGHRFPMSACISGWVMLNRQTAVIPDIYADPRIPAEAYRPTFVRSLAMVPIRSSAPIGAIGAYWASARQPRAEEVRGLQALADTTSVAMENVQLYQELEARVRRRTAELEETVGRLQAAMGEIRTLRGLLPICSHCMKIRDDEGAWQRVEAYVSKHTEAEFSHSICPPCLEQHYGRGSGT